MEYIERKGELRWPFIVGLLMWPLVQDAINDALSRGLCVRVYASGWLVKRGYLVASGKESNLRYLACLLDAIEEQFRNKNKEFE
jgi:hypothetical protein